MAKTAIFDMTSFFYVDIFENGFLYRKGLIEYFEKMYRFNIIGHTVGEINAFEMPKKCYFLPSHHFFLHFLKISNAFISSALCPIVSNLYFVSCKSPVIPEGWLFWVVPPQTSPKTLSFVNNDPVSTQSTHKIFFALIGVN